MAEHTTNQLTIATQEAETTNTPFVPAVVYRKGEVPLHADIYAAGFIGRSLKAWAKSTRQELPPTVLKEDVTEESDAITSDGVFIFHDDLVLDALRYVHDTATTGTRTTAAQYVAQLTAANSSRAAYVASLSSSADVAKLLEAEQTRIPTA